MKVGEIKILVTMDNDTPENRLDEICDDFTDKVDNLCNEFKLENPDIEITCS